MKRMTELMGNIRLFIQPSEIIKRKMNCIRIAKHNKFSFLYQSYSPSIFIFILFSVPVYRINKIEIDTFNQTEIDTPAERNFFIYWEMN